MDIQQIIAALPHRYPFLLVDRVIEIQEGARIKAYKNVTANEEFFNGHFPGNPVMPGVLIIEALAQAAALLALQSEKVDLGSKVIYLAGVDKARFRKPVRPGDRLDLDCTVLRRKGPIWKLTVIASVDGQKVAEAELTAAVADR